MTIGNDLLKAHRGVGPHPAFLNDTHCAHDGVGPHVSALTNPHATPGASRPPGSLCFSRRRSARAARDYKRQLDFTVPGDPSRTQAAIVAAQPAPDAAHPPFPTALPTDGHCRRRGRPLSAPSNLGRRQRWCMRHRAVVPYDAQGLTLYFKCLPRANGRVGVEVKQPTKKNEGSAGGNVRPTRVHASTK